MEYTVTFTQYWEYTVDAKDESEAFDKGRAEFEKEMRRPYAHTFYDEVEVECEEDEEDDE